MRRSALAIVLAAAAASAAAAEDGTGFWGGVDVGVASLERTYSQTGSTRETEFAMAYRGGYAWDPRLLLGLELGGFTLEEADLQDPREGEGIQTFYAIVSTSIRALHRSSSCARASVTWSIGTTGREKRARAAPATCSAPATS